MTEAELLREVADESAEDYRLPSYIVVQMSAETWDKLKAWRAADAATEPPPGKTAWRGP
jgi:hypothetical protein